MSQTLEGVTWLSHVWTWFFLMVYLSSFVFALMLYQDVIAFCFVPWVSLLTDRHFPLDGRLFAEGSEWGESSLTPLLFRLVSRPAFNSILIGPCH